MIDAIPGRTMLRRLVPGMVAVTVLATGAEPAPAAPVTFNTALPVARGEFVFRQQFFYKKASDDPGPGERKLEVLGGVSVLGYGIDRDLAVFAALPLLDKSLRVTTPGGQRVSRDTRGIGDARLFGRYTAYKDNFPGGSFRVAPFAGIEMPTGDDNDRDGLGRLPAALQLGSGSWDPFGGVVATYQTLDYQIDVSAGYQLNTEANDFEFGDVARLDGSFQYRVWPRQLSGGVPGFLYAVLEGNLIYRGENKLGGTGDGDSGGTSFLVSPGIQYVTRRWIAEAIVQIPAVQDLKGTALGDDIVVRAGFRFNF